MKNFSLFSYFLYFVKFYFIVMFLFYKNSVYSIFPALSRGKVGTRVHSA